MANIIPKSGRLIGTIIPDLIIDETTTDAIELTSHPVQQGASISDHKFHKPTIVKMVLMQGGDLKAKYQQLLDLQNSSDVFDISTLKRIYRNMQIKSISVTTDKNTENVLSVTIECQEVIIVNVQVVKIAKNKKHKKKKKTSSTSNSGSKNAKDVSNEPKKTSALKILAGG